jgi:hypothetical protein
LLFAASKGEVRNREAATLAQNPRDDFDVAGSHANQAYQRNDDYESHQVRELHLHESTSFLIEAGRTGGGRTISASL